MIIIAYTTCSFFLRGIKTFRLDDFDWISVSKYCLKKGAGGQTQATCKKFGFLLPQEVKPTLFSFVCFFEFFGERRRKTAQDDVIHHTSSLFELHSFMLLYEGGLKVCPLQGFHPPPQKKTHKFFCFKKPSKFSLSGFDLVGSFSDYYDVVSGPPEMTIERLFFYCVCETSLLSYF